MPARMRSKSSARADAEHEKMRAQIADPDCGPIKRRQLQRRLAGIVAVGPTDLLNPRPAPDYAALARDTVALRAWHAQRVVEEIENIDGRIREIDARFAASPPDIQTYEANEARAERRMLKELRAMIEAEEPITAWPGGRPVDARERATVEQRAQGMLRDSWDAAERFAAAGEFREARCKRVDALRARLVTEYEMGLRNSLPGYGLAAWS